MRKGPERKDIIDAIILLKRTKKPFFSKIAQMLSTSRRKRATVNVSKIARYSKQNSIVVVPGKVLGEGTIEVPLNVVALSFSSEAKRKIENAGGKCYSYKWLVERGAKDVIILK